MKLTRDMIQEAITIGKDVLPKFTAFQLAAVLGVPVKHVLRSIHANRDKFKLDQEKNITGLEAGGALKNLNSNETYAWFVKNRLGGNAERALTLADQQRLMASVQSRVKWDSNFGLVTATFASNELTGADVRERVTRVYSPALAARIVKLGTVNGYGQTPDRYLFGILLTEAEIKARKIDQFLIYDAAWTLEEMFAEQDWTDIEVPDLYEVTTIPLGDTGQPGGPPPAPETKGQQSTGDTDTDLSRRIAGAGGKAPVTDETTQRSRRTKVELDKQRADMVTDLQSRAMFTQEEIDRVAKAEKFTDAEKAYKLLLAEAERIEKGEKRTQQQQPEGSRTETSLDQGVGTTTTPPPASVQVEVQTNTNHPAGPQVSDPPLPPPLNSAPTNRGRSSMPSLNVLENVRDLKADIAAKAGVGAPPAVSTAQPVVPPVAAPPAAIQIPPTTPQAPVSQPPPAGASASAEDLLNNLLKATGQGG